jgi:hypothetical protein
MMLHEIVSLNTIFGVKLLKKQKPADFQRVLSPKSGDGGRLGLIAHNLP